MENTDQSTLRAGLVDSVLLIDADNDPHLPSDFVLTQSTLVRVFLRAKAELSKSLQKRIGGLPLFANIVAPLGTKNAADFVMSMHAGLLHASIPMHVPFSIVTNDKALTGIVQELQRVGRVATLWTSHPDREEMSRSASTRRSSSTSSSRSSRSRRGGRGRSRAAKPAAVTETTAAPAEVPASAPARPSPAKSLEEVTIAYERMLSRAKNPPSRLKALLNDIGNRTANFGYSAEAILEELKRNHGLSIDERGRVSRK
ncbi:MAG: hypothetical protein NTY77_03645 [Elusimicrobia bacterium]|nr:hypothetical protein [Elusimicrobiota bacterium]